MKSYLCLGLALIALVPAHAQSHRRDGHPGSAQVVVGAGSHHHHRAHYHRPTVFYSGFHRPYYGFGHFSHPTYYRPYVYRADPVYYYNAADTYVAARPNYAGSGLFWGAVAGAIIGHNSGSLGNNAWRGAAYGAGAGLLIGSIAESRARRAEASEAATARVPSAAPASAAPTAPATSVGQQATTIINNNYYNSPAPTTPMSAANSLFGRN